MRFAYHKRQSRTQFQLNSSLTEKYRFDTHAIVDIPRDVLTIGEIADKISRKYKLDNSRLEPIDEDFFPGDQELDGAFFNQNIKFECQYTFDDWLARA